LDITLVLSSGGIRAAAHIGLLTYLLEHNNINIKHIVGSSGGAVIGGLYASGLSPAEIKKIFLDIKNPGFFIEYDLWSLFNGTGLFPGKKLRNKLNRFLKDQYMVNIKQIDLSIVTTHVRTGDPILFTTRNTSHAYINLADLIAASSAIPAIFRTRPIPMSGYGGDHFYDGGIADCLPIHYCYNDQVDRILVSNVASGVDEDIVRGKIDAIFSAYESLWDSHIDKSISEAQYLLEDKLTLLTPKMRGGTIFDVKRIPEFIEAGYQNAKAVLEPLLAIK